MFHSTFDPAAFLAGRRLVPFDTHKVPQPNRSISDAVTRTSPSTAGCLLEQGKPFGHHGLQHLFESVVDVLLKASICSYKALA